MRVTKKFNAYNGKRFNRPYLAKVMAWPVGGRAELSWGTYLGDEQGGVAEIEAAPGDVIRYGQKDTRGPGSHAYWGIVNPDGSYDVCTEVVAVEHFRELVRSATLAVADEAIAEYDAKKAAASSPRPRTSTAA